VIYLMFDNLSHRFNPRHRRAAQRADNR